MELLDFLAVVVPERNSFSAWSPGLDVASQGATVEEALANLKEALELHLDCLSQAELKEIRKRQGTRLTATLQIPVNS